MKINTKDKIIDIRIKEFVTELEELLDDYPDITLLMVYSHELDKKQFSIVSNMCVVCISDDLANYIKTENIQHTAKVN